jgi:hypothetical protein
MVFVMNMFRMLCFALYMRYISQHCFFYFPLPFAWIFRDFSKFIFEPYCIRIFEAFLQEREPESRPWLSEKSSTTSGSWRATSAAART